jgi:hypothetical protein
LKKNNIFYSLKYFSLEKYNDILRLKKFLENINLYNLKYLKIPKIILINHVENFYISEYID